MTYRYTTRDLLAEPELYHFTPIEGAELLEWYREDRDRSALALGALGGDVADAIAPAPLPPRPGEAEVETIDLLCGLASCRVRGPSDDRVDAWAEVLLRKFEVFKRLRAAYGVDLRFTDAAPAADDAYALLALVLATTAHLEHDLRMLSCLLKVGDVVCSIDASRFSPAGAAAAAAALVREAAAVDALCRRHGVEP